MPVLLVGGYANAGKDAFVDELESKLNYKRTFMSKPLMEALLTLDPIIEVETTDNIMLFSRTPQVRYSLLHEVIGYSESKKEPEVRRLLQILGTEIGRKMFGDNVWIDKIFEEIFEDSDAYWAVTGIRYVNELETLKSNFEVKSVWIHRPGIVPVNTHSSDNSMGPDQFDSVIENNGTLKDLAVSAQKFHTKHMLTTPKPKKD